MAVPQQIDPDVEALKNAAEALKTSSSRKMLRVNLEFLWDYFITHPSKELPNHLLPDYLQNSAPKQD